MRDIAIQVQGHSFQTLICQKGIGLGHMIQLNTNIKLCMAGQYIVRFHLE